VMQCQTSEWAHCRPSELVWQQALGTIHVSTGLNMHELICWTAEANEIILSRAGLQADSQYFSTIVCSSWYKRFANNTRYRILFASLHAYFTLLCVTLHQYVGVSFGSSLYSYGQISLDTRAKSLENQFLSLLHEFLMQSQSRRISYTISKYENFFKW